MAVTICFYRQKRFASVALSWLRWLRYKRRALHKSGWSSNRGPCEPLLGGQESQLVKYSRLHGINLDSERWLSANRVFHKDKAGGEPSRGISSNIGRSVPHQQAAQSCSESRFSEKLSAQGCKYLDPAGLLGARISVPSGVLKLTNEVTLGEFW
jgi:hypothetical protein